MMPAMQNMAGALRKSNFIKVLLHLKQAALSLRPDSYRDRRGKSGQHRVPCFSKGRAVVLRL